MLPIWWSKISLHWTIISQLGSIATCCANSISRVLINSKDQFISDETILIVRIEVQSSIWIHSITFQMILVLHLDQAPSYMCSPSPILHYKGVKSKPTIGKGKRKQTSTQYQWTPPMFLADAFNILIKFNLFICQITKAIQIYINFSLRFQWVLI